MDNISVVQGLTNAMYDKGRSSDGKIRYAVQKEVRLTRAVFIKHAF